MSSSSSTAIAIPKRKGKGPASSHHHNQHSHHQAESSSSSFAADTPETPHGFNYNFTPSSNRFSYGSAAGSYGSTPSSSSSSSSGSPQSGAGMRRRESLMSETFSRQEHTVINVGEEEEGLRLITCVKASQGFDWNQGMSFSFLRSSLHVPA
jgi:hypothetical protein